MREPKNDTHPQNALAGLSDKEFLVLMKQEEQYQHLPLQMKLCAGPAAPEVVGILKPFGRRDNFATLADVSRRGNQSCAWPNW